MRAFIKSVLLGTAAGAVLPTMLIGYLAIAYGDRAFLKMLIWALAVPFTLVFFGSVVVGLPATAILRTLKAESLPAYVAIGAVAGFVLPLFALMLMSATSGFGMAGLGAVCGMVTARTWWRSRSEPRAPVQAS